ncbi:DUF2243 domain-containing protein [Paenibacillus flagellatus]|uniref:DUF2243 domain-containing protein n=1 Tax=Paenibacillus flagellatus TaxID=2211139 RepID=A0A2V5JUW2_9BACL|nr:DUF2243 domain-containing protein [Paenibacillus flagellatus]PYI50439.1 DUF2243 domain-containing protein [Paenibacillus flagellatus]
MFRRNGTFLGAFLLGIGTIGMLDGIVFHQLLQWHSVYMYTDRFHQIRSDGWFHGFVTIVIVAGAVVLWRSEPADADHRPAVFAAGMLIGAGLFNLVEGLVNHHGLGIHHVRPGPHQTVFDYAYDLFAVCLLLSGMRLLYAKPRVKTR